MGTSVEALVVYVQEMDVETTRIAALIAQQISDLQNKTITADQLAQNLQPELDKLKGVGANPPAQKP